MLTVAAPPRRRPRRDRVRILYDRVAPVYTRYRDRWLHLAGEAADEAMLADLSLTLRPGQRVLDAGSGTGAVSRQVRRLCPAVELTMLDLSTGMLAHAADVGAPRVNGSIVQLPFPNNTFDVIVSAWVIETLPDPRQAVTELLRVLAPDGRLLYTFCSRPSGWPARARSLALRGIVRVGFAGRFLDEKRTPWHDCAASHRQRFRRGLTTAIALGKCCTVQDTDVPAALAPAGRHHATTAALGARRWPHAGAISSDPGWRRTPHSVRRTQGSGDDQAATTEAEMIPCLSPP